MRGTFRASVHRPEEEDVHLKRMCVYAGSSVGTRAEYREAAQGLARALGARGIDVVYGAGGVGLMGALADAALESGCEVTGVIPETLTGMEIVHEHITHLRVVRTMHERKALMAEMGEGFIALPGGVGTLEETMEALTWLHLQYHEKPVGLLNVCGYYDPLLAYLRHMNAEGFLSGSVLDALSVEDSPEGLLGRMLTPR